MLTKAQDLPNAIERFLQTPNKKEDGWPSISDDDMVEFSELVDALIEAKWGRDSEGDLPVYACAYNRRMEALLWPYPVLKQRREPNEDLVDLERKNLRWLLGGVGAYADAADQAFERLANALDRIKDAKED